MSARARSRRGRESITDGPVSRTGDHWMALGYTRAPAPS